MKKLILVVLFVFASSNLYAMDLPNTFTNGETTDANKINENFKKLGDAITTLDTTVKSRIVTNYTITDSSGVGSLYCDSGMNEVVVGGGCYCEGNWDEGSNFGVLFLCSKSAGNGWVGGCYPEQVYFDPDLLPSPVRITVTCLTILGSVSSKAKIDEDKKMAKQELDELKGMVEQINLLLRENK